jgi:uncharacterized protein
MSSKLFSKFTVWALVLFMSVPAIADLREGRKYYDAEEFKKALEVLSAPGTVETFEAQYMIGHMYAMGIDGAPPDTDMAEKIWLKSLTKAKNLAAQGDASAQYYLGSIYETSDRENSCQWYQKSAHQGHVDAQHGLAVCYIYGLGLDKNQALGFDWARKSANQGNTTAYFLLGILYENGWGVNKDLFKSANWYLKAAEEGGGRQAQCEIGYIYLEGKGVDANLRLATYWITKAATKGHDGCQFTLGKMYETGVGVNKDSNQAKYWFTKSAAEGNSLAIRRLKNY